MCSSPVLVWSSFPSLLTCCVLLVRVVHNRKSEKVENDEGGVGEQPQLLLIDSQTEEEEVMKLENNFDFPSSHKPEEERHRCEE